MNKIVIASDSFKGTLTSLEVAKAVEKGVHAVFPDCEVVGLSVADGGEGTLAAIMSSCSCRIVNAVVSDPLFRPVSAEYVLLDDGTAVIEMAEASGLTLLAPEERNPMKTTTYGTGELIADALSRGCRRFMICIGGSATNDAGMGMLSALGVRFLDESGNDLSGIGESMAKVSSIITSCMKPEVMESEFIVACDVDSPLCGPGGAAFVFAPQKGADELDVRILDAGLENIASKTAELIGRNVAGCPGAGAAGGLGFALLAYMDAKMVRGAEMVLDAVGFDTIISDADLVVTGEGRIDMQTMKGKIPYSVMKHASLMNIPVLAVGGQVAQEVPGNMTGQVAIISASCSSGRLADADDITNAVSEYLSKKG